MTLSALVNSALVNSALVNSAIGNSAIGNCAIGNCAMLATPMVESRMANSSNEVGSRSETESSKGRYKQVLVAPAGWDANRYFANVMPAPPKRSAIIDDLQRFRGSFYHADGALQESDLTPDGRHYQAIDHKSWHLLSLDDSENIMSCVRYYAPENPEFEGTSAAKSSLAAAPAWTVKVRTAIEQSIQSAQTRGMRFAELGGWCVSVNCRNSREVLRTVLSMFALSEILGGTVGISTATKRHASSEILRRLGGSTLKVSGTELPSYFEPLYSCEMELLKFDSSQPAPKYANQVAAYRLQMESRLEVVQMTYPEESLTESLLSLSLTLDAHQPTDQLQLASSNC